MTMNVQTIPGSLLRGPNTQEEVTETTSAPSLAADGVSVSGYSQLAFAFHSLDTVSAWEVALWLYDGTAWAQALDGAGDPLTIAGTDNTAAQVFNVAGFTRAYVEVSAFTGTSAALSLTPVGPNL